MTGWAIPLLIVALILGGAGLFFEALRWLLIIGIALLVVSFLTGRRRVA